MQNEIKLVKELLNKFEKSNYLLWFNDKLKEGRVIKIKNYWKGGLEYIKEFQKILEENGIEGYELVNRMGIDILTKKYK